MNGTYMTRLYARTMDNGMLDAYPWEKRTWTPVKVIAEYPNFYVCTVEPHYHPGMNFGLSRPYTVTIDKRDITSGRIEIF